MSSHQVGPHAISKPTCLVDPIVIDQSIAWLTTAEHNLLCMYIESYVAPNSFSCFVHPRKARNGSPKAHESYLSLNRLLF